MSAIPGFQQLSDEEKQQRLDTWKAKLTGTYIAKEVSDSEYEQMKTRDPKLELSSVPDGAQAVAKDTPWLYEVGDKQMVRLSMLPFDAYRHIRPGKPITRDLRENRINLYSEDDGKITDIRFF
ncbi:hypothetical protein IWW50_005268 [Coemansia erecta]|nr:hypothetical protein GGF43_000482 [Coemansia sp. RSA 2618]KAJ2819931.1 hypothetical protein IWW50_005268 [Coemansia erecta]